MVNRRTNTATRNRTLFGAPVSTQDGAAANALWRPLDP